MKRSIDFLIEKISNQSSIQANDTIELLSKDETNRLRGGDREYTPMYESSSEMEWGKVSILLDSLK
jgi:hypothetical protein